MIHIPKQNVFSLHYHTKAITISFQKTSKKSKVCKPWFGSVATEPLS